MHLSPARFSLAAVVLACGLLPFTDLAIHTATPGDELRRMLDGLLQPEVAGWGLLAQAIGLTFAFGLLGTLIAAPIGLLLALCWHQRWVRVAAASVRAIHELFWALLLLHVFGLTPLTGLIAIALPYTGIFAKVYAEILAEQPDDAVRQLPPGTRPVAALLLVRLPQAWPQLRSYFFARAECGMRSSAVLGFVGLPTLGYHLEAALAYGAYAQASTWFAGLVALIGAFRLVVPPWSWPLWLLALPWTLPGSWGANTAGLWRFVSHDLWPQALRDGDMPAALAWAGQVLQTAVLPGLAQTLLLSVLALVATGVLTLMLWPVAIRWVGGRLGQAAGHAGLLLLRATPEYLLVYVLLLLWGPSMVPAIVALMLHNAGIIAFLLARAADGLPRRPDAARGLQGYLWEALPRLYGPFLAYLFYRWEIILRESAVIGVLGIATLGFYIDSALAELRLSLLPPLLLATVLLNVAVDAGSRRLRAHLGVDAPRAARSASRPAPAW